MNFITVAVISTCVGLVYGESPCQTPNGRSGECILLTQCEPLQALVINPQRTNLDVLLLQKSKCGDPEGSSFVPKVCCPKQSEPDPGYGLNGHCRTPDGKSGKCISIYSCPHISNLLRPPVSNENLNFVQKSKCESSEQYSVCCASPPESQTPSGYTVAVAKGDCQMTAFPPNPTSECCGKMVFVGKKIIGTNGSATAIDEHPWTVLIEYIRKDSLIDLSCGGSLISGKYVLTAAHCITGRILDISRPNRVRLGEYDTSNEGADCVEEAGGGEDCTDGVISFDIEKTIPHPQYDQITKRNDIGLIRFKGLAPFTDFIRPICLPVKDLTRPENTPPLFSMYAVGWGKTELRERSDIKVQVNLPYVSLEKCQPEYRKKGRNIDLWRGQLCAGGVDGKDSCKGDSGGPLTYQNRTSFQLIGVVSFGHKDCGIVGVPGIYTNVYEYVDWIKRVIVAEFLHLKLVPTHT